VIAKLSASAKNPKTHVSVWPGPNHMTGKDITQKKRPRRTDCKRSLHPARSRASEGEINIAFTKE